MPPKSFATLLALVTMLNACGDQTKPPTAIDAAAPSSVSRADLEVEATIDSTWIVFFKRGAVPRNAVRARTDAIVGAIPGGRTRYVWEGLHAFAAKLPPEAIQGLRRSPLVAFVEPEKLVTFFGHTTQTNAPWGLDRIDENVRSLDGSYHYTHDGTGVDIYVLEWGVRERHDEFETSDIIPEYRVGIFYDPFNGDGADCNNGHGTRVASVAAGLTFGVAKDATIQIVKPFDCGPLNDSIFTTQFIDGLDAIRDRSSLRPAVVNLSLGVSKECYFPPGPGDTTTGPQYPSANNRCPDRHAGVDQAVLDVIDTGVTVVAAAGNKATDACLGSPGHLPDVITVGATDETDSRWAHSNLGSCVTLFAPGSNIEGADHRSVSSSSVDSGTSYAAPFAAGVAALYLERYPTASPAVVRSALVNRATHSTLSNIGSGSPNRLLLASWRLGVVISGPSTISPGSHEWHAGAYDGVGHYTYQWYRRTVWPDGYKSPWMALGTSATQSLTLQTGEQNFELRVDVTSHGQFAWNYKSVAGPCNVGMICPESTDPSVVSEFSGF